MQSTTMRSSLIYAVRRFGAQSIVSSRTSVVSSARVVAGNGLFSRIFSESTLRWLSTGNYKDEDDEVSEMLQIERIIEGQSTRFGWGTVAKLAEASVVGTAGQSLVLATVSAADQEMRSSSALAQALCSVDNDASALTVSYQERYHAVGRIPTVNRSRRDTTRSSDEEILAARAIDRALRPLLLPNNQQIHVSCSVQAFDGRGSPVALALNAASVALRDRLSDPVAAVHMCLLDDGSLALDPTHDQVLDSVAELLFAGTRKHVIMMEATSYNLSIPEEIFSNLMRLAHGAIQPILDTQEALRALNQEEEPSDEELRTSLGLGPSSNKSDEKSLLDASGIFEEAYNFCLTRFEDASLRLFGYEPGMEETPKSKSSDIRIHPVGTHLLSKSVRGRREHILFTEIDQALRNEFEPTNEDVRKAYKDDIAMLSPILTSAIHKKILQKALYTVSSTYQTRGDNRGTTWSGDKTIRPVSVTVPALPDSVHGSCLFSRGETQVLCTTTLGAPRDGMPHTHPYEQKEESGKPREPGAYDHLPVGSLRYLRSQEALISDFNTKRIKADKEITGESGTLDEVRRFFMHYDFPSYSKGELPSGRGNRREVGHGRLAERALLSSIPAASDFPYAMRVTSEVTSSNGSSSMASVCGATIALLDAGVPLIAPVAGVSVGLALGDTPSEYHLLLDITGTEDHYGWMDFKVAGTEEGITALQLDVKRGLPMEVLVEAVDLARKGREALLDEMDVLSKHSSASIITKLLPRPALKESAPRVEVVRFDPIRKRDLVGPGGAVLRQLEDRFQVSLDLSQDGQCLLFGRDREMVSKAKSAVMDLVADVEEGQVYEGTVIELKDFGAILELLRNKEGLLHVSELLDDLSHPEGNYGLVHQHLRVGQKIQVLCTGVDPVQGTIRLSYKALKQRHVEEMKKRQD